MLTTKSHLWPLQHFFQEFTAVRHSLLDLFVSDVCSDNTKNQQHAKIENSFEKPGGFFLKVSTYVIIQKY